MASECIVKAGKASSVSGKGDRPKKSPNAQPPKEEDCDDFSCDDDDKDEKEELPPSEPLDKLLGELNSLIGLAGVKRQVQSMVNLLDIQKKRAAKGLVNKGQSFHLIFTGKPGTGKTTIARLIAKIYRSMGLLRRGQLVETDRAGLVGQYIGETAVKTQNALARAEGGVLFIDEAYALAPEDNGKDFGREAIDTLLKAMEDNRDNLLVIVAGYPDLMDHFINHTNPGLPSRFPTTIFFEDYSADELRQIFELIARNADYVPTKECIEAVKTHYEKVLAKRPPNFANARDVRNLFQKATQNQADRLNGLDDPSLEQLKTLLLEDLPSPA
jgi:SpoVK/Ycf46/Vps4 family AAA+-type ATPase